MRGIIRYYGKYKMWALQKLVRRFHFQLAKWVVNKYKGLKRSYIKAHRWIDGLRLECEA